jgi:hypothetical protein
MKMFNVADVAYYDIHAARDVARNTMLFAMSNVAPDDAITTFNALLRLCCGLHVQRRCCDDVVNTMWNVVADVVSAVFNTSKTTISQYHNKTTA